MVTCPEPVYEAEVVIVAPKKPASAKPSAAPRVPPSRPTAPAPKPPKAVNPYADLDDDKPYALASPPPVVEPQAESRRPCPKCGGMIVVGAAKCRFCGEVFDEVLKRKSVKKPKAAKNSSRSSDDSGGTRDLVIGFLSLVVGLGLTLLSLANPIGGEKDGRFVVFYGLIFGGIVGVLRGVWTIARGGR
jgi:hypothetical protein